MRRPIPITLLFLCSLAVGCSGLARGKAQVSQVAPIDPSNKMLVLLSQTPYVGDLAAELGRYGFRVRPLVRQGAGEVAATSGGAELALFEKAKYGIQIEQRFDQSCAFTSSSIYAFTVMVIDIETNDVVLVVRQTGADGPCTTVGAVWPTIAKEIADHWGPLQTR